MLHNPRRPSRPQNSNGSNRQAYLSRASQAQSHLGVDNSPGPPRLTRPPVGPVTAVDNIQQMTVDTIQGLKTRDAFQNTTARLGWGMPNLMESTSYPLTRITRNYQLMNSLYRSHWIARRIIDVIPEDMLKNGWTIQSQLSPEQIDRVDKQQRTAQVRSGLLEGLKWGRLYGGAAAVILIAGHESILDQPLDVEDVYPDSFKGLLVVDRWSGIFPGPELVSELGDPHFGMPSSYLVTDNVSNDTIYVHHSRILRFIGRQLPFWEKQAEVYWGASEIEHVFDELRKRDNTSYNIAGLVFNANLKVLQMGDLGQMLTVGGEPAQQMLYQTVQMQNWLMNNFSMYLIDKEDNFDTKSYSFGGLGEVYDRFMMDVAGAAEIPVTKLFGRSPAGMNATGEGDLQNYYDTIEEKQEAYIRPVLDSLLPVLLMSTLGAIPDDFDYKFLPVHRPTDKERAELAGQITNAVLSGYNAKLIKPSTALKELRQASDVTGMWSNVSDEDIATADEQQASQDLMQSLGPALQQGAAGPPVEEGAPASASTPEAGQPPVPEAAPTETEPTEPGPLPRSGPQPQPFISNGPKV